MNLYTKGESLSPIFQQSSRHGVAWGGGRVKGGLGVGGGSAAQESHSSCPPPPTLHSQQSKYEYKSTALDY
jgi:hypothetical protein